MKRITPRTCLWPVTFTLIITFVLSIGLTYQSDHHCYAGTCGEWLFPLQARLHVVIWYIWISLSVAFLGFRTFSPKLRALLRHDLTRRKIPLIGKHLSLSGILVITWICILYGALIANWWIRLKDYFTARGVQGGIFDGNKRLAAIALTGHVCDVTMGMVLLPISRHSALASFFKLSVSTTLTFHMLTAYTLFTLVTIHGFLYVSWLPVFSSLSSALQKVYPVLNPTYTHHEAWPGNTSPLGVWRASLVFTGLFSSIIMILIFITTLPEIRRRHFNLFYFTHLSVILAVIVICLHASTMFYCTSPGLVLWLLDWALRIYELSQGIDGNITTLGNRYHILTMKIPRNRLSGCACTSPLAHFYIYHSESSIRELHPFTTITSLASEKCKETKEDITVQFLFRKQGNSRKTSYADTTKTGEQDPHNMISGRLDERDPGFLAWLRRLIATPKKHDKLEWTERLANSGNLVSADPEALVHPKAKSQNPSTSDVAMRARKSATEAVGETHPHPLIDVRLRLEGPYFTPADPYRYKTVICLVAGTGISGGIAIANAFAEAERQRSCAATDASDDDSAPPHVCQVVARHSVWDRCVLVWSVREDDYTEVPMLKSLQNATPRLELQTQLTGNGRPRMDFTATLSSILEPLASERGEPASVDYLGDTQTSSPVSLKTPALSFFDPDGNCSAFPAAQELLNDAIPANITKRSQQEPKKMPPSSCWVYLSGPNAFITAGERACAEMGVEYYGARWEI